MRSCKEVTEAVASGALAEAGLLARLGYRLHLLVCPPCRCYARQLAEIGGHTRCFCDDVTPLPDEVRHAIAERCARAARAADADAADDG